MTDEELIAIKSRAYGPGQEAADLRLLIAEVDNLQTELRVMELRARAAEGIARMHGAQIG